MQQKPILKAKNIFKNYTMGKSVIEILKGISFEIYAGEIIAIMGPSGVGKSTLLHILGALDRPTHGKIEINEIDDIFSFNNNKLARFRNNSIGFVFQFHNLLPEFSALENVMMPAMISSNGDINAMRTKAMKLLDEVGLTDRYNHRPGELSGGEQQRVAVARALINSPQLILADEPSGNLDLAASKSLHRVIWDLNNRNDQTIIIVTHNIELANKADRIIELFDGKIKNNKQKDY